VRARRTGAADEKVFLAQLQLQAATEPLSSFDAAHVVIYECSADDSLSVCLSLRSSVIISLCMYPITPMTTVWGSVYSRNMCVFSYHWLRVEKERKHESVSSVY